MRLSEKKLRKIVTESVNKVLIESQQMPIDPSELAQSLYDNDVDVLGFIRQLESAYRKINRNSSTPEGQMKLYQAIKNAESFVEQNHNNPEVTEAGYALLKKPLYLGDIVCEDIGYEIVQGKIHFVGGNPEDGYNTIFVGDAQIPKIINFIE